MLGEPASQSSSIPRARRCLRPPRGNIIGSVNVHHIKYFIREFSLCFKLPRKLGESEEDLAMKDPILTRNRKRSME